MAFLTSTEAQMSRSPITNRFGRSALCALMLTTVVSTAVAPKAGAQVAGIRPLPPGTRVRVTSPVLEPQRQVVTTLAQRPDTFVFRSEGKQDSIALPLANVSRLELSAGKYTRMRKGAVVGALAGAAIGAVVSYATYKKSDCADLYLCDPLKIDSRSAATTVGAIGGGLLGGLAGGVVGAVWRAEDWHPLPLAGRGASLRVIPAHGGVALSASF